MKVKNLVEAIRLYKKAMNDAEYDRVTQTPTWYIFTYNKGNVLRDPVGVNKETGEVRGLLPPLDIDDLDSEEIVWEEGAHR